LDDEASWKQLEVYIRDHSEAEFSHGIRPECMEKTMNAVKALDALKKHSKPE